MPTPQPHYHWRETGRIRVRTGWFGILVVEREQNRKKSFVVMGTPYDAIEADGSDAGWETRWKRAPRGAHLAWPLKPAG